MKRLYIILASCLALVCCTGGGKNNNSAAAASKARSTGGAREVVAVIDNDFFSQAESDSVRTYFAPVMFGLPQEETETKLYVIPRSGFSHLYQTHRNIILIEKDTVNQVKTIKDAFAAPQTLVRISATDINSLNELMNKSSADILKRFHDGDIAFLQEKSARIAHKKLDQIRTMGVELTVPNYYRPVRIEPDFIWLLKDVKKGKHLGTVNILIYKYDSQGNAVDPIMLLDEITKKYVPGPSDGSYMTTEKSVFYPMSEQTELDGQFAIQTRGLWRTENDFMGGPFINYTVYDDKSDIVYGIDGFVYFPSQDKAHYIFELESILKTFKIAGR